MRPLLFVVAGLIGLEVAALWLGLDGIGFPDGHRTERDRFREKVYPIFIGLFALLFSASVFVALRAPKSWKAKALLISTFAIHVISWTVYFTNASDLEDGWGG